MAPGARQRASEWPSHPPRGRGLATILAAGFAIGPIVALDGGDGQAITAYGSRIATFGAAQATWWTGIGGVRSSVALPQVPVHGARWSADGTRLFAGPGTIDVARGTFTKHPAFAPLSTPGPPGKGSLTVKETSWSADGKHAAALVGWSGPVPPGPVPAERVVVLDLASGAAPVTIAADGAIDVRIVGDRVVVAAPTVRVWSLGGAPIAALPAAPGAPLWLGTGGGGHVILVDPQRSLRVVSTSTWSVQATWPGPLLDAVAVPEGGFVGIDFDGKLYAGCLDGDRIRQIGTAETGIRNGRLAVTGDGRLAIMGAGAVPVHTATYWLSCAR